MPYIEGKHLKNTEKIIIPGLCGTDRVVKAVIK